MRKALMMVCLLPSLAWADVLPSGVIKARERMEQDPEHYDRAEVFFARGLSRLELEWDVAAT